MKQTCDYGSGSTISIGENIAHAVIAIDESGKRFSIALTPGSLRTFGEKLIAMAEKIDARNGKVSGND